MSHDYYRRCARSRRSAPLSSGTSRSSAFSSFHLSSSVSSPHGVRTSTLAAYSRSSARAFIRTLRQLGAGNQRRRCFQALRAGRRRAADVRDIAPLPLLPPTRSRRDLDAISTRSRRDLDAERHRSRLPALSPRTHGVGPRAELYYAADRPLRGRAPRHPHGTATEPPGICLARK